MKASIPSTHMPSMHPSIQLPTNPPIHPTQPSFLPFWHRKHGHVEVRETKASLLVYLYHYNFILQDLSAIGQLRLEPCCLWASWQSLNAVSMAYLLQVRTQKTAHQPYQYLGRKKSSNRSSGLTWTLLCLTPICRAALWTSWAQEDVLLPVLRTRTYCSPEEPLLMNGKMAASHANIRGSLKASCTKVSSFIEQGDSWKQLQMHYALWLHWQRGRKC